MCLSKARCTLRRLFSPLLTLQPSFSLRSPPLDFYVLFLLFFFYFFYPRQTYVCPSLSATRARTVLSHYTVAWKRRPVGRAPNINACFHTCGRLFLSVFLAVGIFERAGHYFRTNTHMCPLCYREKERVPA